MIRSLFLIAPILEFSRAEKFQWEHDNLTSYSGTLDSLYKSSLLPVSAHARRKYFGEFQHFVVALAPGTRDITNFPHVAIFNFTTLGTTILQRVPLSPDVFLFSHDPLFPGELNLQHPL